MAALLSVPRIDGLDRSARWVVDRLGWDEVDGWDGMGFLEGMGMGLLVVGIGKEGQGRGRAVRVWAVARVIDRPGGLRSVLVVCLAG